MELFEYQKALTMALYNHYSDSTLNLKDSVFVVSGLKDRIENDMDFQKTMDWVNETYTKSGQLSYSELLSMTPEQRMVITSQIMIFDLLYGEDATNLAKSIPDSFPTTIVQVELEMGMSNGTF